MSKTAGIIGVALWFIGFVGLVVLEGQSPDTDVFLFKEAGVNLATEGRFVVANLPHMPINKKIIYAYYPPVYPFLYGAYSKIAGIGLKQSIFFDALTRVIRSLLLFALLLPFLNRKRVSPWLPLAILLSLSFVTTQTDRPDELAAAFGLGSWVVLINWGRRWIGVVGSGVLLGICGATSPAAGALFALGYLLFWFLKGRSLSKLAVSVLLAMTTFVATILPVYLADPVSFERFSKQVPLSTFPYLIPFVNGVTFEAFWEHLTPTLMHYFHKAFPHFHAHSTACLYQKF